MFTLKGKSSELYKNTRVVSWHCEPKTAIERGELFTYDSIDMEIKVKYDIYQHLTFTNNLGCAYLRTRDE